MSRPEWADVAAWQAREDARRASALETLSNRRDQRTDAQRADFDDLPTLLRFAAEHESATHISEAVWARFGVREIRFTQKLNALIDTVEALRFDPGLVYRLQARRDARATARVTPRGVSR